MFFVVFKLIGKDIVGLKPFIKLGIKKYSQ